MNTNNTGNSPPPTVDTVDVAGPQVGLNSNSYGLQMNDEWKKLFGQHKLMLPATYIAFKDSQRLSQVGPEMLTVQCFPRVVISLPICESVDQQHPQNRQIFLQLRFSV